MKKIILPSSGFPLKINSVKSVSIPSTAVSKQDYIEKSILLAVNRYNPKLGLKGIDYENIKDMFPNLVKDYTKLFGLIVEDIEISSSQKQYYNRKQYYVWDDSNKTYARKILTYVIMLDIELGGRNTAISQSIFPVLTDLMDIALNGPCFKLTNHPVYMINMYGEEVTASSIYNPIAYGIASGIEYVEVFRENLSLKNVPQDIKSFIERYDDTYNGTSVHRTSEFEVDFDRKELKLKTDKLVVGEYLKHNTRTGVYDFNGSSEKFYWMDTLPYVILAQRSNYNIDYRSLEDFYNSYESYFSPRSSKMPRFLNFTNFIKKVSLGSV